MNIPTLSFPLPAYPELPGPGSAAVLQKKLLPWFRRNMRPLPWRADYDPYSVWLSEIMLQQTQMERATEYFLRWKERFPTIACVAQASLDEILKAWEGLGYYSRAKNVHAAARTIMQEHHGRLPDDPARLALLPGIGPYTAGAIASIAFDKPAPAVDANVQRVFSRLFDVDVPAKSGRAAAYFWKTADRLVPQSSPGIWNQALMELGALVCRKAPQCGHCPLQACCHACRLGIPAERPIGGKKVAYTHTAIITGVLVHNGRILIQKRLDQGVWGGLWEFPGGRLEPGETPEQGVCREFAEETELDIHVDKKLGVVNHSYTRYRITMHCFLCSLGASGNLPRDARGYPQPALHAATENKWELPAELNRYAFPAGHRKLLDIWGPDIESEAGSTT